VPDPFFTPSKDLSSNMDGASSAHTAFLMVEHVLKSYDGFFALQYVGKMMEELSSNVEEDDAVTLKDLIDFHVSIMSMVDVSPDISRSEIMSLLKLDKKSVSKKMAYANAVTFAARKNIHTGSAFVNGRPVLLSDPRELQTVLMEELTYLAELIQLGRITDSKPRSVYGLLLSEERVYPQMHPLLAEPTKGLYHTAPHDYNHMSVLTTLKSSSKEIKDFNTMFLLEVGFDVESEQGIDFALSCLRSIHNLREKFQTEDKYNDVALAVRFIPLNASESDVDSVQVIMFCAGSLDIDEFHAFLLLKKKALMNRESINSYKEVVDMIQSIKKNDRCMAQTKSYMLNSFDHSNYISLNGRFYIPPMDEVVHLDDLEILIDLEKTRSRAITQELKMLVPVEKAFDIIGRVAAYLGKHYSLDKAQRKDVDAILKLLRSDHSMDPLIYSWNQGQNKVRWSLVCNYESVETYFSHVEVFHVCFCFAHRSMSSVYWTHCQKQLNERPLY